MGCCYEEILTSVVVKYAFLCCVLWYKDRSCIRACIVNVLLCFSYNMQNGLVGHRIASLLYGITAPGNIILRSKIRQGCWARLAQLSVKHTFLTLNLLISKSSITSPIGKFDSFFVFDQDGYSAHLSKIVGFCAILGIRSGPAALLVDIDLCSKSFYCA